MTKIIDIRACDDPRDVIHRVVERLAAGELVGLPTENSYAVVAQASHAAATTHLAELDRYTFVLAVKSADEALDFATQVEPAGERLLRRLWPGPLVVEAPFDASSGLLDALPGAVRRGLTVDGHIRLRMPEHEIIASIQRLSAGPIILVSDRPGGPIMSPAELESRFGGAPQLVIDDGPPAQPGLCTIVRLENGRWSLIEPGLIDEETIFERTSTTIVFVCTGNTCRSPLAEAMFRKLLAERLHCSEDELPRRGFLVASAGISAGYDMPAAADSLALAEEFGLNLSRHRSRPLTDELLDRADYIFAMTSGHRAAILSARPDLAARVHLLSREGLDIADPIGGGPAEYERCRAEIERELLVLIEHLPIDPNGIRG